MLRRMMKDLKKQEGFTLLEVLVVIAILGIIAAMITPKFLEVMKDARVDTAKAGAKQIQTGLERINFKNNAYPASGTALDTYDELQDALGSSANLPELEANSPVIFKVYRNPGTTDPYELILVVRGADSGTTQRCIEITPSTIVSGTLGGTDAATWVCNP